ncbi:MAG: helix-turn-helix domain-containing protein [Candidatus Aenigmarchaeota archaeon]|nr:helix-turn-helix domain-containing protein [Candidatus Aenigmarchaeota archaeon]
MFDKNILMGKIINTLHENDFETFVTHGSFDLVAKREHLFLIKNLLNIDALDESHALDLRATSYFLSAYPLVISQRNNRDHLGDDMVYTRFDISVMTPQLFKSMLEEEDLVVTHSSKGRHTQEINAFALKEKRLERNLTLEELADQVGISKKAMYEIENKRVNPQKDTVRRLERLLGAELALPFEMKHTESVYIKPKGNFQRDVSAEFSRIGIDNSSVNSTPFEIIAKGNSSIITSLSNTPSEIKNNVGELRQLSVIFSSRSILVSKSSASKNMDGIPVLLESELLELQSSKHLHEIIDERT